MRGVGGTIVKWLFVLLSMASVTTRANAESCSTAAERVEMAVSLRHATQDRPVHITFATRADGVKMPGYLIEKYPDEITIITRIAKIQTRSWLCTSGSRTARTINEISATPVTP